MTRQQISELAQWMAEQAERVPYGEITVTLRIHEGRETMVERVTERIKNEAGITGGRHGYNNS